jgi:hypothetical protein
MMVSIFAIANLASFSSLDNLAQLGLNFILGTCKYQSSSCRCLKPTHVFVYSLHPREQFLLISSQLHLDGFTPRPC